MSLPILPEISPFSMRKQNSAISSGFNFKSYGVANFSFFTKANKSFVNQFAACFEMLTSFSSLLLEFADKISS